ncbi:ATP-dependent RNA helicase DHX29 [Biomphalaria pfeifferi]|uniref:ATP-dependent RNA helicase DHX29 n=1 Tax=Biomphalaria pfeifferi TaxID=112525 RepID=A0AAD8FLY1_BIOPF|nr:ATP-dependent RNA helicase DHX29 [Biomphalaria pfeifferi]
MYRIERKETNEGTEACYVSEAFIPDIPAKSTSMNRADQDYVGYVSKPVAVDLKDHCLSAGAYERNSKLDNCIQKLSMNCNYGNSHRECRCQENYQQDMCTSAIIIDIGKDECQSIQAKYELTRGRPLQLELEKAHRLDV